MTGTLRGRADALLDQLSPAEQLAARRLLVRLVSPGDGANPGTRRRVPLRKLRPPKESEAATLDRVLAQLTQARLLVFESEGTEQTLEVAHEALIRSVAFDPGSHTLLSASADKTVGAWQELQAKVLLGALRSRGRTLP